MLNLKSLKYLSIIALLLIAGCMQPRVISVHGESLSIRYDPVTTNQETVLAKAEAECLERFGKSKAVKTLDVMDMEYTKIASFECQ